MSATASPSTSTSRRRSATCPASADTPASSASSSRAAAGSNLPTYRSRISCAVDRSLPNSSIRFQAAAHSVAATAAAGASFRALASWCRRQASIHTTISPISGPTGQGSDGASSAANRTVSTVTGAASSGSAIGGRATATGGDGGAGRRGGQGGPPVRGGQGRVLADAGGGGVGGGADSGQFLRGADDVAPVVPERPGGSRGNNQMSPLDGCRPHILAGEGTDGEPGAGSVKGAAGPALLVPH